MKKQLQVVAMLVIVALVAAAACFVTSRFFPPLHEFPITGHEWVHKQLNLTADQQKALDPIETKFEERKRTLLGKIRDANRELAEAIKQDQANSPRVVAAVATIYHAQGELQQTTLEHVFEMKSVLSAEQYRKLLDLTAHELDQANGGE